jgi:hypothetical protein
MDPLTTILMWVLSSLAILGALLLAIVLLFGRAEKPYLTAVKSLNSEELP